MRWLLVLCFITSAGAQAFSGLATTGDGSVLYFSSTLRMKGTDHLPYERIYRWTARAGVQLHAERPSSTLTRSSFGLDSTGFFRLAAPTVSADGVTLAFTGRNYCSSGGQTCLFSAELFQSEIRLPRRPPLRLPGRASLSPNGRYAMLSTSRLPRVTPLNGRLIDLDTGESAEFPSRSGTDGPTTHRVANDGTALSLDTRGVTQLWKKGVVTPLPVAFGSAGIDGEAAYVIGVASTGLAACDIRRGVVTELAPPTSLFDFSGDASVIVYVRDGHVFAMDRERRMPRQVSRGRDAPASLVLSGNGRILFVTTTTNAIERIDLSTGAFETVVPAIQVPPALPGWQLQDPLVAPGSLVRVWAQTPQPLPEQVYLSGRPVPVLSGYPLEFWFQVPWTTPADPRSSLLWVELDLPEVDGHPFDAAHQLGILGVRPSAAQFFEAGPGWPRGTVLALHEDFSGLILEQSPARPGEIVHLYGTGFGPVTPEVTNGSPAPAEPLARATARIECNLLDSTRTPLAVLFAGLAPGFVGVFQIDVRLPPRLSLKQASQLSCSAEVEPLTASFASGLLFVTVSP